MLKIYRVTANGQTDITKFCSSVTYSGSLSDVSRRLEITMFYSLFNETLGKAQIGCGDKLLALWNDVEIFQGIVVNRDISSSENQTVTALDYTFYLKQSKVTFNFKNTSAESATMVILKSLGVTAGTIESTGIKQSRVINQKSGYDAIMDLYYQVSKQNKKKYYIRGDNGNINVYYLGKHIVSKEIRCTDNESTKQYKNLISFGFKDSIEGVVNRVKIYNSNNIYVGMVENKGSQALHGLIQDEYVKEDGKDQNIVAQNMLKDINREVEVEILGDLGFRSGSAVNVRIPMIDILANRHMYIVADTHTWDMRTNNYTTSLTLSFNNEMSVGSSE